MRPTPAERFAFWFAAANAAAVLVFVAAPHAAELPAGVVAIAVFVGCALAWPVCRPDLQRVLSPRNIALFLFWLQLVVMPVLIGYNGFSQGTLPKLPSQSTINLALLVHAGAYVAFAWMFQRGLNRGALTGHRDTANLATDPRRAPTLILFMVGIGLVGLVLAFPTLSEYIAFLTDPSIQRMREQEMSTFPRAAATFLRPFLTFGIVLAWGYWLVRGQRRRPWVVAAVTVAVALCLPFLNFNYNRGSMFGPVIALGAAYSCHVRRLSLGMVAGIGAVLLFVALLFGSYRAGKLQEADLFHHGAQTAAGTTELVDFVQVYGNAPQFSAFLMERVQTGGDLYWGRTLISSLCYPLPILGKPFRPTSGVEIYNQLIYGTPTIVDQVILYEAEFYINFHAIGVLIGYGILGWIFSFFQRRFDGAGSAVETFSWLLMGLWIIWPGSLPVTSQLFIYAFWPIYFYFFLAWRLGSSTRLDQTAWRPPAPRQVVERRAGAC